MRKYVMVLVVAMLSAGVVHAQDGGIGLGFQHELFGIFDGMDGAGANTASIRTWLSENFGLEGNISHRDMDDMGDMYLLGGKGMYAPIVRENSKMYVGLEGMFGQVDEESEETDVWLIRPLFGAQFHFEEIPELGFVWEVGYGFGNADTDFDNPEADDEDIDLSGVMVTVGAFYFLN